MTDLVLRSVARGVLAIVPLVAIGFAAAQVRLVGQLLWGLLIVLAFGVALWSSWADAGTPRGH